jgi:hypothetical protein
MLANRFHDLLEITQLPVDTAAVVGSAVLPVWP